MCILSPAADSTTNFELRPGEGYPVAPQSSMRQSLRSEPRLITRSRQEVRKLRDVKAGWDSYLPPPTLHKRNHRRMTLMSISQQPIESDEGEGEEHESVVQVDLSFEPGDRPAVAVEPRD